MLISGGGNRLCNLTGVYSTFYLTGTGIIGPLPSMYDIEQLESVQHLSITLLCTLHNFSGLTFHVTCRSLVGQNVNSQVPEVKEVQRLFCRATEGEITFGFGNVNITLNALATVSQVRCLSSQCTSF